jgi:GNAT superfamily N-acetyltransferase
MQATENKAREQFVSDFLLVAENDQDMYNHFKNVVQKKGVLGGSELIQQDFEFWISRLATDEEERGNGTGSLLLRQLLIGWGADSFYQIAKRFEEINEEESEFLDKIETQEKRRFDYLGSLPEEN